MPPRIWILTSGRTGDDKQALRLGAALDGSVEEKKIVFSRRAEPWRLILGASLTSIEPTASASLEPPWPDLAISVGWRQVPVMRWIRARSRGRTRLVQLNRPPGLGQFDLVMAPPQYRLPRRSNVMTLQWPLHLAPDRQRLREATSLWETRLARYPRPWTVLLLGGTSWPFALDAPTSIRVVEAALERTRRQSGSLMISTSRRTPSLAIRGVEDVLRASPGNHFLYSWKAADTDNPYLAFLDSGHEFIVTPDSVSMMVEVARMGRPLSIAEIPRGRSVLKSFRSLMKTAIHGAPDSTHGRIRETFSDLASLVGLKGERDLGVVSQRLIEEGWAAGFPNFRDPCGQPLPDPDFDEALCRVRAVLDGASERAVV